MRLSTITIKNVGPFRGEHQLQLQAIPYAVVARDEENEELSNGIGKSRFLKTIDWALWRRHDYRLDDDVITRGEAIGEAVLEFDNGVRITRRRERGKRTTLYYHDPENPHGATQDEAQALVEQAVGLSAEDFIATCYLEQGQMGRLIVAKPEPRMKMVAAWLRLGPLERCEDRISDKATESGAKLEKLQASLDNLIDLEKQALGPHTREELEELRKGHEEILAQRRSDRDARQAALEENAAHDRACDVVSAYEALISNGKAMRLALEAVDTEEVRERHESALQAKQAEAVLVTNAATRRESKRVLMKGEFDGRCPVAGIDCPAKDEINADYERARALYDEADTDLNAAREAFRNASQVEAQTRTHWEERQRLETKLRELHDRAEREEEAYEQAKAMPAPEDPTVLRERHNAAEERLQLTVTGIADLSSKLKQLDQIAELRTKAEVEIVKLRKELTTLREAASIFGKQGAQRVVAEDALSEIEQDANKILAEVDAGVQIAVRWSREGGDPATACGTCGAPFPKSTKVKACARCQATRGAKLINKLDIDLSDRSGGLVDLSGIALQLAASQWLRVERQSAWSVLLADEPTASLDRARRKMFTAHLARMFSITGYEQAFIAAHTSEILESLPGRILITKTRQGSRIEVVT